MIPAMGLLDFAEIYWKESKLHPLKYCSQSDVACELSLSERISRRNLVSCPLYFLFGYQLRQALDLSAFAKKLLSKHRSLNLMLALL